MKNKRRGFALIEVIVSMVILSIMLAAAVGLLWSVSAAIEANRDRLAATYLAQECLELARNARDTAWRNHRPWDCAWQENSNCEEKNIISDLTVSSITVNGEATKFSRKFVVSSNEDTPTNDEVLITCSVSWEDSTLSISEILTNWRKA
jgi:prepilin-type N-terminal cleavage/methylation domain-containing protein